MRVLLGMQDLRGHDFNKLTLNKSFQLNFLVHKGTYGVNQHILNSRKEIRKLISKVQKEIETIKTTITQDDNLEQALFEYKDEINGFEMIHRINMLKYIEQQDVLLWTYAFKEISRVCNLSPEAQQNVL